MTMTLWLLLIALLSDGNTAVDWPPSGVQHRGTDQARLVRFHTPAALPSPVASAPPPEERHRVERTPGKAPRGVGRRGGADARAPRGGGGAEATGSSHLASASHLPAVASVPSSPRPRGPTPTETEPRINEPTDHNQMWGSNDAHFELIA